MVIYILGEFYEFHNVYKTGQLVILPGQVSYTEFNRNLLQNERMLYINWVLQPS